MMKSVYLVRYGLMRHVGVFVAECATYERGDEVVVRSRRGTELGEVLAPLTAPAGPLPASNTIVRQAGVEDTAHRQQAQQARDERFVICERVFRDGVWPFELVDVEALLDDGRTVVYYLGPHHLEAEGLISALRETCGLDVWLEPVGCDEPDEAQSAGCGSCGASGGGCGSEGGGCGASMSTNAGGCSGCAVKELVGRRLPA